jgi:hypothetical protein
MISLKALNHSRIIAVGATLLWQTVDHGADGKAHSLPDDNRLAGPEHWEHVE